MKCSMTIIRKQSKVDNRIKSDNIYKNKEKKIMSREITKAVNEIIEGGTKIVSFKYRGEDVKNVLIGSKYAEALVNNAVQAIGDKKINRAMTKDGKSILLYGISNNEGHFVAYWDTKDITDFSFLFGRHYKRTLWEKIVDFFKVAFVT